MLRGSRPGERRGGRQRGTPNRRTILADRILAIGLDQPTASLRVFLLKLVRDAKLPADTRMAVAPNCFPAKRRSRRGRRRGSGSIETTITPEALAEGGAAVVSQGSQTPAPAMRDWNPQALEGLLGIVQDGAVDGTARRKAALKISAFLLPKVAKKAKALPDEYGFAVHPNLASAYRDIQLELRALMNGPNWKIPAIALKIKKLEARADAIRRRLQAPCPSKYGFKDASKDSTRLLRFTGLRDHTIALSEAQDAEEAHVKVRFAMWEFGPQEILRRRRKALEKADQLFKKGQLEADFYGPPLSRQEQDELGYLRRLFADPKRDLDPEEKQERARFDEEFLMCHYHPFKDERPAPDGNFYPLHTKLRLWPELAVLDEHDAPDRSGWPTSGIGRLDSRAPNLAARTPRPWPAKSSTSNQLGMLGAVLLDFAASARLRQEMLRELNDIGSDEQATKWAQARLPEKNKLNAEDAKHVEEVFRTKLLSLAVHESGQVPDLQGASSQTTKDAAAEDQNSARPTSTGRGE